MKKCFILLLLILNRGGFAMTNEIIEKIKWLGQASVRIEDEKTIYIDPYQLTDRAKKGDIILITHDHMDHLDNASIKKILTKNTFILLPEGINFNLNTNQIVRVKPNSSYEILGYKISTVPAYNVKKTNFHNKSKGYVGYIIEINGKKIYHTGDTERIPEMKNLSVDIIMLPLGQTYTMNSVEEASEAALDVKAKIAIPIHFGMYEGNEKDALKFKEILNGRVNVIILPRLKD